MHPSGRYALLWAAMARPFVLHIYTRTGLRFPSIGATVGSWNNRIWHNHNYKNRQEAHLAVDGGCSLVVILACGQAMVCTGFSWLTPRTKASHYSSNDHSRTARSSCSRRKGMNKKEHSKCIAVANVPNRAGKKPLKMPKVERETPVESSSRHTGCSR